VYDVRDLLGHWVKPREREEQMCPHACCRGRRTHPDKFPVILAKGDLRSASEAELLAHWERHDHDEKVSKQVLGEVDRRDQLRKRNKHATANEHRTRDEFRAHLESEWTRAEEQTRGNMLNKRGEKAGIDPRSLFTGDEARVSRYASEELRRYFEDHPRVGASEFSGGAEEQRRGGRRRRESRLYGIY
jgi:hypothetical protein